MEITHKLKVQPIIVSTTDGTKTATFLGTAAQQAEIEGYIDDIWEQAGIDVEFLTPTTYNDDFAYDGFYDYTSEKLRSSLDLSTIVSKAGSPPKNSSTAVLNMFFVNVVPGFKYTGESTVTGLAFVDRNGIAQFVGSRLLTYPENREKVATGIAHEIGHNLGLPHINQPYNLMQAAGSSFYGQKLTMDDRAKVLTEQ